MTTDDRRQMADDRRIRFRSVRECQRANLLSVVCQRAGQEGAAGDRLTRFFMRGRFATPLAELLQLEAIPRVGLVLGGHVVAPLAPLARERDGRSFVTCHRYLLLQLIRYGCVLDPSAT